MRPGRRLRVALAAAVLACAAFAHARSIPADLDTAWQAYADRQSHAEPAYVFPHSSCFAAAAAEHGLPLTLLLAVARGESDFEPTARSRANAHGVMQILWPVTAKHLGIERLSQLYDPCTNIEAGARYLKELLGRYDGNLHLALAAYNYGPSRIPVGASIIPSGAEWYSGYIYRHLAYVLGDGEPAPAGAAALYSELGQSTLLTFGEPYRAIAFIERIERRAPELELDWFRRGTGRFEVVMSYADRDEFDRHSAKLRQAGFRF
jgi:hypothetical protein